MNGLRYYTSAELITINYNGYDGVMGDENIPFRLNGPGSGPNKKPLSQGSKNVLIKIGTMYIHT